MSSKHSQLCLIMPWIFNVQAELLEKDHFMWEQQVEGDWIIAPLDWLNPM